MCLSKIWPKTEMGAIIKNKIKIKFSENLEEFVTDKILEWDKLFDEYDKSCEYGALFKAYNNIIGDIAKQFNMPVYFVTKTNQVFDKINNEYIIDEVDTSIKMGSKTILYHGSEHFQAKKNFYTFLKFDIIF